MLAATHFLSKNYVHSQRKVWNLVMWGQPTPNLKSVFNSRLRLGPFLAFTIWALSSLHNKHRRLPKDFIALIPWKVVIIEGSITGRSLDVCWVMSTYWHCSWHMESRTNQRNSDDYALGRLGTHQGHYSKPGPGCTPAWPQRCWL